MTDKHIQKLIDRYLEGATSPEDEKRLARELLREDIPADWQAVRMMLGQLAMGEAEYDAIMAKRRQKPSAVLIAISTISSIAAIFLVGLFFFVNAETPQQPSNLKSQTSNLNSHARPLVACYQRDARTSNLNSQTSTCQGSTPRELYMCYMERKKETPSVYTLIKKRIYENQH